MIYQIAGLVIVVTATVCGTIIFINDQKQKAIERRQERARIAASAQHVFDNNAMALYENERAMRIEAQAQVSTKEFIIKQKDKEIERLKGLLEFAEGRAK